MKRRKGKGEVAFGEDAPNCFCCLSARHLNDRIIGRVIKLLIGGNLANESSSANGKWRIDQAAIGRQFAPRVLDNSNRRRAREKSDGCARTDDGRLMRLLNNRRLECGQRSNGWMVASEQKVAQ